MKLNLSINTVNNTLQKSQAFVFFHPVQLSFSESVDLFSWCTGDRQLTWCLSRLKLSVSFSNHTSNLCEIRSHWRSVGSQELLARFSLFHANFYLSWTFIFLHGTYISLQCTGRLFTIFLTHPHWSFSFTLMVLSKWLLH